MLESVLLAFLIVLILPGSQMREQEVLIEYAEFFSPENGSITKLY